MKTTTILSGLVFAILFFGILASSVSALKKVDVEFYPSLEDLKLGDTAKFNVRVTNTGDEKLPKDSRLYFGLYSGSNRLRHISKNVGALKPGQTKTIAMKYNYKFGTSGRYTIVGQVYYGKQYPIFVNSDSETSLMKEFDVSDTGTNTNVATSLKRVDLSISPNVDNIKLRDAIQFTAKVMNAGNEKIEVARLYVRIYKDGKRVRYVSKYIKDLMPGQSMQFSMKSYTFKKSGKYALVGEVHKGYTYTSSGYFTRGMTSSVDEGSPMYVNSNSRILFQQEFTVQ